MFYCYLFRKNPYEEHYDVIKVNEYMDLVSLAKVLDELMKKFPGMLTVLDMCLLHKEQVTPI